MVLPSSVLPLSTPQQAAQHSAGVCAQAICHIGSSIRWASLLIKHDGGGAVQDRIQRLLELHATWTDLTQKKSSRPHLQLDKRPAIAQAGALHWFESTRHDP